VFLDGWRCPPATSPSSAALVNARGEHTSALFAFANTVIKLRTDEARLLGAGLGRRADASLQEFAEYKATRKPMPEEAGGRRALKELAARSAAAPRSAGL
jgi:hypothetical protein